MGGRIIVGTASWTDRTLIESGKFYPPSVKSAAERLAYYASQFRLVEVDSTYYFPPSERNSVLWVERTPDDFTFDIKAYGLLTKHPVAIDSLPRPVRETLSEEAQAKDRVYEHHLPPAAVDEVWDMFQSALMPLHSAGKLGAVLLQFPVWFTCTQENREYLAAARCRLPQYELYVEFRNAVWMNEHHRDETLDFLEKQGLAYTVVDEPQGFPSSVPPVVAVTSKKLGVVRFHGRNKETWERSGSSAAERFKYLYGENELAERVPSVKEMAAQAREVHVLMNNCYRDYGVHNARDMARMLDVEMPASDEAVGRGRERGDGRGDGSGDEPSDTLFD